MLTSDACSWWRMRLVNSATCYKRLLPAVYFFNIILTLKSIDYTDIRRIFV